jgi:hypothetical protein
MTVTRSLTAENSTAGFVEEEEPLKQVFEG